MSDIPNRTIWAEQIAQATRDAFAEFFMPRLQDHVQDAVRSCDIPTMVRDIVIAEIVEKVRTVAALEARIAQLHAEINTLSQIRMEL